MAEIALNPASDGVATMLHCSYIHSSVVTASPYRGGNIVGGVAFSSVRDERWFGAEPGLDKLCGQVLQSFAAHSRQLPTIHYSKHRHEWLEHMTTSSSNQGSAEDRTGARPYF